MEVLRKGENLLDGEKLNSCILNVKADLNKLHKSVSSNLREYFAAETHDKASCAR